MEMLMKNFLTEGLIMSSNRDDFSPAVKDILAKRAAYRCSNPACKKITVGAQKGDSKSISIGIAAHIAAAAPKGPRYDASMTAEERMSADNGIWLCANCSTLIDKDEHYYTVELLHSWKKQAEEETHDNIRYSIPAEINSASVDKYNIMILQRDLIKCQSGILELKKYPHSILDLDNFPLPDNWETILANNSLFLGVEFTVTLHDICNNINRLKQLMDEETRRIKTRYPNCKIGRIADTQAVVYCNRLDCITAFLFETFTQEILDTISNKLS